MPTFYLHVGCPKTGTTSIQAFLASRRQELFDKGLIYTRYGAEESGRHLPLMRVLTGQKVTPAFESCVTDLSNEIAANPRHDVLVSCELLEYHFRDARSAIVDFCRARNFHLKFIVYVRNQTQALNSRYAQNVKILLGNGGWQDFLSIALAQQRHHFSRWIDIARHFGADLVARPFTGRSMTNGVVADFVTLLGRSVVPPDDELRTNVRASAELVATARTLMNRFRRQGIELTPRQRPEISSVLVEEDRKGDYPPFVGLKTDYARIIAMHYRGDNEYFSRRMWSESWEDIFAEDLAERFESNEIDIDDPASPRHESYREFLRKVWPKVNAIARDETKARIRPWTVVVPVHQYTGVGSHFFREETFP